MTRYKTTLTNLALLAALSSLPMATPASAADIGPESITLEQIGAVRMVSPQEERQEQTSRTSNDQSHQRATR